VKSVISIYLDKQTTHTIIPSIQSHMVIPCGLLLVSLLDLLQASRVRTKDCSRSLFDSPYDRLDKPTELQYALLSVTRKVIRVCMG
jgi:hypothetical protein